MPSSYQRGAPRVNAAGTPPKVSVKTAPNAAAKPTTPPAASSVTATAPATGPATATPTDRAGRFDRNAPRATATFVPYYWEAYNEIVEPRIFDRYLIRKWLPDLGQTGFLIVKILRDRCYFNPATSQKRDQVELRMDELAKLLGIGRSSLFKIFAENKALAQFVRRIEQYQFADGKPRRDANLYQVCMDDPIHWDDLERYDDLRAQRESERDNTPVMRVFKGSIKDSLIDSLKSGSEGAPSSDSKAPTGEDDKASSYESTTGTHSETGGKSTGSCESTYESTTRTHRKEGPPYESATRTVDTTYLSSPSGTADTMYPVSAARTALEDLPSGSVSTDSLTPSAPSRKRDGNTPQYAPQGANPDSESEGALSPLTIAWSLALATIEPMLSKPLFGTHVSRLVPIHMQDLGESGVEIVVEAPSAFTREWVEKREISPVLARSLEQSIKRPVTVRFTQKMRASSPAADAERANTLTDDPQSPVEPASTAEEA